jgi:AraC family transcriptional regulator of arabinose operon
MIVIPDITSAVNYLNQITQLEVGGGSYLIHNWNAQPSHLDNQLHKHSFFEVCYVVSGTGIYLDKDREIRLESGDLFCSRPHTWHRIHGCRSLYLIWISFEMMESRSTEQALEFIKRLRRSDHFFIRDAQQVPSILAWQSILAQAGKLNGLKDILIPLASGFLAALINSFQSIPEAHDKVALISDPRRLLQQANVFIHDNLSRPLQLKDVADYLHVSERNLSRLFHEHDEQTFVQCLKAQRLQKASILLMHTDKTIQEIATECGFESVHYFTRVFTFAYRTPPGKYRKRAILNNLRSSFGLES